jgi:predicted Zn-dependent protease
MVDVINVLKNQERFADEKARMEGRAVPAHNNWLASHPSNDQRLNDITRIAAQYQGNYRDEGRSRYLNAINGIYFGESREQGVTRGQKFFHEGLGIALTAPDGWKIQNGAEALTLINAAGDAGLIVKTLPANAGASHDEVMRKVLGVQQAQIERFNLSGLAATHYAGNRRNAQGQVQSVEATLATGPDKQLFLLLYASKDANALYRARREIQLAEDSFRPMSAADKAAAKPWQIRTVPYPSGGFAELARHSPLPTLAEKHLRLINGFYSGGEPKPGQLVKVVE